MAQLIEVKIPDIGGFADVPVIEIAVKPGDRVAAEDSLITLESDKATMDVPAPQAGVVQEVRVAVGDRVSEGHTVLLLDVADSASPPAAEAAPPKPVPASAAPPPLATPPVAPAPQVVGAPAVAALTSPAAPPPLPAASGDLVPAPAPLVMPSPGEMAALARGGHMPHASPSVRRFARELGVDVAQVSGSGPKGRITQQDVQSYVKAALAAPRGTAPVPAPAAGGGLDLLPWPKIDFTKFGAVNSVPLSRIKKISGANLARNWAMIPHVTQFDEADITDLEAFRVAMNKEQEKAAQSGGVRLTMLAFLIKASVAALKKFPEFNASLDGDNLVLKQYFHIGFAADTPNGLVVPVLKNADQKGVAEIAREMGELAKKARDGKLGPADMQGGCFSISSLGGIGGTAFTPIINAPEVAILGVSKTQTKPVWDGTAFVPRQMLPLSLSYDHRVIDGAAAARFTSYLAQLLADMRRVVL